MYSQIDSNRHRTWLLIAVFMAVLVACGWVYGYVLTDSGAFAITVALMISVVMTLVSWFAGDKIALSTTGAVEVADKSQFPELWNAVENLAIADGLPMPKLYIVPDNSPNAFATGRDREHASVAVTAGLLRIMNKDELQGVLAHELSHIQNGDSRVMMLAAVLVGAIAILGNVFLRFGGFGGGRRGRNQSGLFAVVAIVGLIFLVLSPIIANLIKLAISRRREYLADASGALLTRYPEGLASALEKIRDANVPMAHTSAATNHLWISEPRLNMSSLFSTHPPIDERIRRLRGMIDEH